MKIALRIIIPLLIIFISYKAAGILIAGKPPLQSKQPPAVIPTVSTISVRIKSHSPPILSYGTVRSFFETTLSPQVNGQITFVSPDFRIGKKVSAGTLLAKIDATDYEAVLARESANLTANERTLEEEVIRGKQAEQDWIASGRKLDTASPFVLRKPQLAAASASIASSKAAIKKAQADIDRCSITAPFDAVIATRSASLGNFATIQSSLGTLVATDHAEVRLPLTPEQAQRVDLSNKDVQGLEITLTSPTKPSAKWTATLTRTDPVIDPRNQVVFVIAEIQNPYEGEHTLPVGTFVNAAIPAKALKNALRIPETALINDSFIWVVDKEMNLQRVDAKRIYSHQNFSYVQLTSEKDLPESLTIVSRPLTSFKTGMKVKLESPNK
jgi:RND family efflux transporter MFP subunit